jgi:alpha-tubulin suppressor-like RCC1 family protein
VAQPSAEVAVAAGTQHTLLLRSDGVVKAFGLNLDGQTDVPTLPPPSMKLGQIVVPMVMFHCPFEP